MTWDIRQGDCVAVMAALDAESIDAVVTDPPYGLEFMGKEWDRIGDIGKTSHAGIDPTPGFKGFVLPSTGDGAHRVTALCAYCQRVKEISYSGRRLGWGIVRLCAECVDRLASHP